MMNSGKFRKIAPAHFFDEVIEQARAARSRMLAYYGARDDLFWGASLSGWLDIAQRAGVPSVPATLAFRLPRDAVMRFDAPTDADRPYLEGLMKAVENTPEGNMIRWDGCSSLALKWALSECADGADLESAKRELMIDDPRAFDILYEQPDELVKVWYRPWIVARSHGHHPVEYRVFVRASEVIGVANYYVQRALPDSDEVRAEVAQAKRYAERIVSEALAMGRVPWMPVQGEASEAWPENQIHATLDFLVREDGELMFLEAGPPFGLNAAPCAFEPAATGSLAIEIAGVALGGYDTPFPAVSFGDFFVFELVPGVEDETGERPAAGSAGASLE